MADVQIDDGEFTRIANVLLEQTSKIHLNGTQYSIILTVWRFTYGFQRRSHSLSVTFIATATGISTRAIKKELKVLIDRNVLLVIKESTKAHSRVLKFNKDYDTWRDEMKINEDQGNKQSPELAGEQLTPSQGNNQSPQQGNKTTPKKETKENSKEYSEKFLEFWNVYPRKMAKTLAWKAWTKITKKNDPELLISTAKNYSLSVEGTEEKHILYPATFLGPNDRFNDYLIEKKQGNRNDTRSTSNEDNNKQILARQIEELKKKGATQK